MVTFYPTHTQARADAASLGLREKVLCFVTRDESLLVFEHADVPDAGVQVPAGGVEAGETPEHAAIRELTEEAGLVLDHPRLLVSYRWEAQLPERVTRQVCHAYTFTAPACTPDAWTNHADGHLFAFRWALLTAPGLHWEMDAALPWLTPCTDPHPTSGLIPVQETFA